ncbi:hypothetical protein A2334_05940 [Candidatus Roizmanbacteria bacterium RIFOXYB2_FULL_38_10]|uniref:Glycosyl transferase family 1 domain-containing protein n=1 Tax=Candidatus Roizmanbacteria bacterium RIFOXYD1_FULL_38_12 TaxID=1802093 RepID=A0A1F7L0T8_9BACT|nr:MAG: hypothetical protein A3K47_03060 [Candidatus Roizmanbacteria bacterium RIFOXYA2_FULL_38_14]OGK63747.1 MAG: hypothetical protein A3K27_03060 [Candidatus Roizmanbacteria bacterium RIFOXYA1_FULL_37_12]OGK65593.1 MAG: hypothetical protein A3K38_03060 [Candidatus Roizmanbacteria bacterium RIFOXYB1_FULL_40_23]OGK68376.1 MAG: hypothetical protein A2334_05940 [Candidatus Roizmanbacteria bacterium RIFOXYB2_FULL_38_10]OGK69998.1 MAG: hypothetical protein A3K21_03065 [Candidatus Roizmanbacteria ba
MKKTAVIYDKWLHQFGGAELVACTIADILKKECWDVTFIGGKYIHLHKIRDKFGIDLNNVQFYEVWNHENHLKKMVEGKDLFINLSFMDYSYGYAKKNIYYTHFPTPLRSTLFNLCLDFFHITGSHILFPTHLRERIYNRIRAGIYFDMKKRLDSYDTILANSQFTKKWIKNYWNKESKVLYPPVTIDSKTNTVNSITNPTSLKLRGARQNWIVSVGRFFTLGHGKKQEVMIEAFKKLIASVKEGWELHLVGGVGNEPSSLRFVEHLKKQAKGYPIFFHFNISHSEVLEILKKSKIYWHATGHDEDENTNPLAFEHFGIAAVEGILSGCHPILYKGGGLPEILGKFNLLDDLHTFTGVTQLIKNTHILMKKAPIQHVSNPFSDKEFRSHFLTLCTKT